LKKAHHTQRLVLEHKKLIKAKKAKVFKHSKLIKVRKQKWVGPKLQKPKAKIAVKHHKGTNGKKITIKLTKVAHSQKKGKHVVHRSIHEKPAS